MSPQKAFSITPASASFRLLFGNLPLRGKMQCALTVLAGAGMWFGFANPVMQLPLLVFLYPVVLTVLALHAENGRRAFRITFITGTLASASTLYWIAVPVHDYGGLPWFAAVPCVILLGAYLGLYAGIFGFLMHARFEKTLLAWHVPIGLAIAGGSLWTVLEHLRGILFSGFPWLSLSSAFAGWPFAVQGASIFGAYTLSGIFTALALGACLSFALLFFTPRPGQPVLTRAHAVPLLLFCAFVLLGLGMWGVHRLNAKVPVGKPLDILMVQGNIEQNLKWSESYQEATLEQYLTLTDSGMGTLHKTGPRLIIWPETAMPFFFQSHPLGRRLVNAVHALKTPLLFGAPGFTAVTGIPRSQWPLFNCAYLLVPGHPVAQIYEKEHLVPFGEYLPSFLDFPALEVLFQGVGAFSKGIRTMPLDLENLALGLLICYETIFPELAQARVGAGATVLVNISNDAWFGFTSAPLQHLQQAAMRAIEQGRFLVRCTNTGITAIIDNKGRIVKSGALYVAQTMSGTVFSTTEKTLFHRYGNQILMAMYGICIAFFAPICFATAKRRFMKSRSKKHK